MDAYMGSLASRTARVLQTDLHTKHQAAIRSGIDRAEIYTSGIEIMKNEYSGNDELGWGFVAIFAAILISGIVMAFVILI